MWSTQNLMAELASEDNCSCVEKGVNKPLKIAYEDNFAIHFREE